jgi:lipoate-protein ligase B
MPPTLRLYSFEHLPYARGLELMRRLAREVREGAAPALILCQHEPVVTLGRRVSLAEVESLRARLAAHGIPVFAVERGGLATYHGPGQVVAYPVLSLPDLGLGVRELVTRLEEAVIAVLAELGLAASRRDDHPGVWVGPRKIASVGLAVQRGVTLHGLALNNRPRLEHFALISPCGLDPDTMTSLERETGRPAEPALLYRLLAAHIARGLGLEPAPANALVSVSA